MARGRITRETLPPHVSRTARGTFGPASPVREAPDAPVPAARNVAPLFSDLITDEWGIAWSVTSNRPTDHDFHLFFGTPASGTLRHVWNKLIVTPDLARCLRHAGPDWRNLGLGLGEKIIKKLRRRLGLTKIRSNPRNPRNPREWWGARHDDLLTLTTADFCARHGVSTTAVNRARERISGPRRTTGGWRSPSRQEALASGRSAAAVAAELGLSEETIRIYRKRMRREKKQ